MAIRSDDPDAIRRVQDAARRFADFDEEEEYDIEVAARLIQAFGNLRLDREGHRRAAWLCVLATRRILHGWSELDCEGTGPHEAIGAAARWVASGEHPGNFAPLCLPAVAVRECERVADCDACRVEPIAEAAARTALFTVTANPIDGAIALCDVRGAVLEGVEHPDGIPFERWLVEDAVIAAATLRGIGDGPDGSCSG